MISHREATVRDAGEILVLEQGGIAERGGYAELLAVGERFADLVRRQRLAEEIEATSTGGENPE